METLIVAAILLLLGLIKYGDAGNAAKAYGCLFLFVAVAWIAAFRFIERENENP